MAGLRICYLPLAFHGSAASFYRCHFPFHELKRQGHEICSPRHTWRDTTDSVTGKPLRVVLFDLLSPLPDADVYVFQMHVERGAVSLVRQARAKGALCIGEADDNTFALPDYHPASKGLDPRSPCPACKGNPRCPACLGSGLNAARNWDHLRSVFQACDALTVSTPALKESYAKLNPNISVLPNYLHEEMWSEVTPQYEEDERRVRVGWMGEAWIRSGDLEVLKPVIRPFLEAHPEVDFVAAGDASVHDILEVPHVQRVNYPYQSFPAGLPRITATMDIGLVPLELNEFNQSKSALKGMEYAACGIPCIASPTEEYKRWVRPWQNGFLAADPAEWRRFLEYLVSDHAARKGMGRAAKEQTRQHTIAAHAHEWADLYESLLARKGTKMAFPRSRPSSGAISRQRSTA